MWSCTLGNCAQEAAEARSLHISNSTLRQKWRAHHLSQIVDLCDAASAEALRHERCGAAAEHWRRKRHSVALSVNQMPSKTKASIACGQPLPASRAAKCAGVARGSASRFQSTCFAP
jgi:hypothetical protein